MTKETQTTPEIELDEYQRISERALELFVEWDRRHSVRHMGPLKENNIEYWVMIAMKEDGYEKR